MLHFTKKQIKSFNLFWLGFIIYYLAIAFIATNENANHSIFQAVQFLGLVLMVTKAANLIKFKIDNKYLQFIYTLYCTWLLIMIVNGFHLLLDYSFLKSFLFNPGVGLLYFTPLMLLFPINFVYFKKLFDVIFILGIIYLLFNILFIKGLLNRSSISGRDMVENFSDLSISSGFLLLTYSYHSKKKQLVSIVVIVVTLLFVILYARRNLIFICSNILVFSYILHTFRSKKKILIIYLTIFIALLGTLYINGVYKPRESPLFGFLVERAADDTRTGVELYFYDDMKTKDWIMGRGINGKYYAPNIEEDQLTDYRYLIETGYLQTILKGGLLSLGLFLLIAIPAIIKGFFFSKNILSKTAAIWILMSQINSYPTIINSFSLQYLLVWVSISICYSKKIRKMKDSDVRDIFHELQNTKQENS